MSPVLSIWAQAWGIPAEAIADLQARYIQVLPVQSGLSETAIQQRARLQYAQAGVPLWRNNVGAARTVEGGMVRYGLSNDSKQINEKYKSSDLIGITPITVLPVHVGQTWGVFTSYEVKRGGWTYSGRGREQAQRNWLDLVASHGGIAGFITGGTP